MYNDELKSNFITKLTDDIVCPWCGYEHSDSSSYSPEEECLGVIYCDSCEKPFYGRRTIDISYTTAKPKIGKCSGCGEDNVVIESRDSCPMSYRNLCEKCAVKVKIKFWENYHKNLNQ